MCKNTVKKLQFVKKYVRHCYRTKEMCGKVILGNFGMLMFIPDCYKNQKCLIKLLMIILKH